MHTWTIRGAAALAAIGMVACGGAGPTPVTSSKPIPSSEPVAKASAEPIATIALAVSTAPPEAPKKRAKVRFYTDGDDYTAPLVDVVVGGQPTSLLVDTGATSHVIASWVADQIGPTTSSGAAGVDHTGKKVALSRLEGADILVSGWGALGETGTLVAALPPQFQEERIGGVLSPQSLAKEGRAVVLDLRKGTLTEASLEDATKALEAEPGIALSGEMRDCGAGGLPFVKATIGGVEVEAQLDTGATHTTVRAAADVGIKLKPLAKGTSSAVAASGLFTVPSVEGAHVVVGALDVQTIVDLVKRDPRKTCPNDAFLGIDVLKRCAIVLGTKTLAAKCDATR